MIFARACLTCHCCLGRELSDLCAKEGRKQFRVCEGVCRFGLHLSTVRVVVKGNYLALVALVGPSTRLNTAGRAVLASRGPCPVLELADATARAAQ